MLSKEEIEKVNKILSCDNCPTSYACESCNITWTDKQLLKKYIAQLEEENKALKKGITSLMASRKKWKYGYYKEKRKFDKQSKVIDEMVDSFFRLYQERPGTMHNFFEKGKVCRYGYDKENNECREINCKPCIKQYFEKKVEEK